LPNDLNFVEEEPVGDYINDFLKIPRKQRTHGVYLFYEGGLPDMEDDNFYYRILRDASSEKPGLIAVKTKGFYLRDVFSTSYAPHLSYVKRNTEEGKTYEATLSMALGDPGKHYVIHGPSKVGKTQLWKTVFEGEQAVPVPCNRTEDIGQLYSYAIFRLKKPHLEKETVKRSSKKAKGAKLNANVGIQGIASFGVSSSDANDNLVARERQYAYQSQPKTAMAVADAFSKYDAFLVFENYHRLRDSIIEQLSLDLREFSDKRVSVLLVGIPEHPYKLFDFNKELSGRVEYLKLRWWSQEDLAKIALAGGKTLNVDFTERTLELLSKEASGSPLLMQQFCIIACLASGITKWCDDQIDADVEISRSELGEGIKKWVANTLKPYENCKNIMETAAREAGLPGFFVESLFKEFKRKDPSMSFSLPEIGLDDTFHEAVSRFINLLNENQRTEELFTTQSDQKGISILDPNFFVYVRWLA